MSTIELPSKLRKQIRAQRRAQSIAERHTAALAVSRQILKAVFFLRASRIAFYVANDGELDPQNLIGNASLLGKQCFLPVITDELLRWHPSPLRFQQFNPGYEELVHNRFGIPEPAYAPRSICKPEVLDIIFMPLVGFDRHGNRLGMGAGYYDRTLAQLHRRFKRPRLVGLAYAFQELPVIEANPWDVPMDAIVTERELIFAG